MLCLSVNDAVLHGLPHDYVLRDGDLLSIDMAAGIDGWVADSALSVIVGTPDPADLKLIEATEVALEAGIAAAQPGGRLGDISAAIGEVAHSYGYGVNAEFGGHGIGRTMHEAPHVSNIGRARRGPKLDPGLTIAIEPWFCRSTDKSSSTMTAGRSAPPTAPAPPTPNTPSPSPERPPGAHPVPVTRCVTGRAPR